MYTASDMVLEFNTTFGVSVPEQVEEPWQAWIRIPEAKLRFCLIKEELEELLEAIGNADIVEVVDALGDIVYVVHGALQVFGLSKIYPEEPNLYSHPSVGDFRITTRTGVDNILHNLSKRVLESNAEQVLAILHHILDACYETAGILNVDLDEIISIIHSSNMSKLGADGEPVYHEETRKVLKGPDYWAPTEKIKEAIF